MTWLSVLVPVFNVEDHLEQCVTSILDQADQGVEIVLCDDCSTDGSLALAQRLAEQSPEQVRVIHLAQNSGPSAARNALIEEARGDYLWFVDSDDYLLPGAIAAIRAVAQKHAPDVISGDYRKRGKLKRAFKGLRGVVLTDRDRFAAGVFASRKMYSWLKVVHRRVWDTGVRFPVGKMFEDATTTAWMLLAARSFLHLDHPLVEYRVWGGSLLSGITRTKRSFNAPHHRHLAHALDGYAEALDPAQFPRTRFAASHFLAMEFARICLRIRRAGAEGLDGADPDALVREFRATMDAASPIGFAKLNRMYLARGDLLSFAQLTPALLTSR